MTERSGALATIYLDRVEALARAGGVRVSVILARAMAHELGHLLLGTSMHSVRGLMRPVWTRAEVVHALAADWIIPEDDGRRMRLGYLQRLGAPPASTRVRDPK